MLTHDADDFLEVISVSPELTIESHRRQLILEALRSMEDVALSGVHSIAVPVAADAVELLTHEPACRVMLIRVIVVSKHNADAPGSRSSAGFLGFLGFSRSGGTGRLSSETLNCLGFSLLFSPHTFSLHFYCLGLFDRIE